MKNLFKKGVDGKLGITKSFKAAAEGYAFSAVLGPIILWDTMRGNLKADEFIGIFKDDRLNRAATIVASPLLFANFLTVGGVKLAYEGASWELECHNNDLDRAEKEKKDNDKNDQGPKGLHFKS
ncbi:MAG: hypothetical protein VYC19_03925 [Pseudomonadota bacterium]|nr:hypothetical protein [Pseudomonadota bacterium]